MKILALETSSTYGSVSIYDEDRIVFAGFSDIRTTHSERILPQIDHGLKKSGISIAEIDLICLGNGPGSFTGIRIGLATAKGLCLGNKIPLKVFNTLDILVHNLHSPSLPVLAIIDARMGEVYAALYDTSLNHLIPPCNLKPEQLIGKIGTKVIVIGDGYYRHREILNKADLEMQPVPVHLNIPRASAMIGMYLSEKAVLKFDFEQISELEPFYLRKSQAEMQKNKKEK